MPTVEVLIPQMGEGLQEVRIVAFMKQPGEPVKRDELLYTMETDKAIMEVESPSEGVLVEWLADEDAVLAIGAPIARIDTGSAGVGVSERAFIETTALTTGDMAGIDAPTDGKANGAKQIPPRTRAHCRELGISDEEMRRIPAPSGKLMPGDVDAYLAAKAAPGQESAATQDQSATAFKGRGSMVSEDRDAAAAQPSSDHGAEPSQAYAEHALSQQQRVFIYRAKRSAQVVIPATMRRSMEWSPIARFVKAARAADSNSHPTEFQALAYCVAQAVRDHPKFRSILPDDATVREYPHVNLGIAVARPNGELVTAMVPNADTLNYRAFIQTAGERIKSAREIEDQATADTQILLTYLGAYDIVDGVPVLIAPAVAVLFIGSSYEQNGQTLVNLSLTFDHRLINGVEAADFLRTIVAKAQHVDQIVQT